MKQVDGKSKPSLAEGLQSSVTKKKLRKWSAFAKKIQMPYSSSGRLRGHFRWVLLPKAAGQATLCQILTAIEVLLSMAGLRFLVN